MNHTETAYQRCSNCVMDTTDFNISFDDNGICDHCQNFSKNIKKTWNESLSLARLAELKKIAKNIRVTGKGNKYDCIIGISGGTDSSYMLHYVVTKLKLRPLVFHVDGGWNTKSAVNNINNLVTKLNLDLYVKVIDWEEMRSLQLAFFRSGLSNIDTPQDQAFFSTLFHFAKKHNIKYIFNGGNISTENVQVPLQWIYYTTDLWVLNDIVKKYMSAPLKKFEISSAMYTKFKLRYINRIKVIKALDYIPYIKNDAIKLLKTEYNFETFKYKHWESSFTRFYEGYWLPERFGFDTRKVTFSSMIVTNQMDRNEAIKLLDKPAMNEIESQSELDYVSKKIRVSVDELNSYKKMPLKTYKDYRNQHFIYIVGAKIMDMLKEDISGKKR